MVDNFGLVLCHGLILLALWRLLFRPDLDDDSIPPPEPNAPRPGFRAPKKAPPGA